MWRQRSVSRQIFSTQLPYARCCDALRAYTRHMLKCVRRARVAGFLAVAASQLALLSVSAGAREPASLPPSQVYGELFQRVQTEKIFADGKTFADAVAKRAPADIMRRYTAHKDAA